MSWNDFKEALASRVAAVPGVGKTYTYWPLSSDASTSPKFKATFGKDGVLNFWAIQRTGFSREKCPDDDSRYLVTHDIRMTAVRALQEGPVAESEFQATLDAVGADFKSGDRTLGGLVNTLSIPGFGSISEVTFGGGVAAYKAEASFRVEEIES